MSSEVVVSKSPLISGRFECDIEIPVLVTIRDFLKKLVDKRLQIVGQDGNTYTICFQISGWVSAFDMDHMNPFSFWADE